MMRLFQIKRDDNGFTVLEAIVAISILTIGLLAVASMQVSSIRGNSFAGGVTTGTTWASDKIEELMELGLANYDDTNLQDTDGDGDTGLNDATAATADFQETQGDYTIYWNISNNSLLDRTKTISVIVTWTDHGVQKKVSIQHIIPEII